VWHHTHGRWMTAFAAKKKRPSFLRNKIPVLSVRR
jgi:hypothetical protein